MSPASRENYRTRESANSSRPASKLIGAEGRGDMVTKAFRYNLVVIAIRLSRFLFRGSNFSQVSNV
jgi:hypothetical protein